MSNGVMIILIFSILIIVPIIIVFTVLAINKANRKRKYSVYTGVTTGRVSKLVNKGLDFPWVIYVTYCVNQKNYQLKETAKLKSSPIKAGDITVGLKKTFVLGPIQEGDTVTILYDEKDPQKAVIYGNNGVITG